MEREQENSLISSMKKVLVIAPYSYLPFYSGGQKSIAKFLEYLGLQVSLKVITVEDTDPSLTKNYELIPLLKKSFWRYIDFRLVKKITAIVQSGKFDTVIWEHPYYAWLAFRIRNRTGIKTIIHTHNIEYQRFRSVGKWWWPVLKMYEKWAFKKADALFFVAPEDANFVINEWKINEAKCVTLAFGIDINSQPTDKANCKKLIAKEHQINADEKVLLFTGVLNYKPNLDALKLILEEINPLLMQTGSFRYKILVCGKGLPAEFDLLNAYLDKNIIYTGFVADIEMYYKGADIFLNPVQTGGGVKTKIVEAIAFGTTVISTISGAIGIKKNDCGQKLIVVPDNDWKNFAAKVIENSQLINDTPESFYQSYFWGGIVEKAVKS